MTQISTGKDTDNSEDTDRHGYEKIRCQQGLYNLLQILGPQIMKQLDYNDDELKLQDI